jgi:hypothetical protein
VSITSVAEAHAYLARGQQQWSDAEWEGPRGRRWPASQAARLVDAGISHERAEHLCAAGFTTVEQVLGAAPPQLSDTARAALDGWRAVDRVLVRAWGCWRARPPEVAVRGR